MCSSNMRFFVLAISFTLAILWPEQTSAQAVSPEQRVALVIGNSAYPSAPLRSPVNDATDLAAVLKKIGFAVTLLLDASRQQIEAAVERFSQQLRQGGIGLFYYSGHGTQVDGINYLLPIDVTLNSEADVKNNTINANWVTDKIAEGGNRINLIILDACRTPPSFTRRSKAPQEGLAPMLIPAEAASGILVAYATDPGRVAWDGTGRNSLYTKHLLTYLQEPGLPIELMFKRVRTAVEEETAQDPAGPQRP